MSELPKGWVECAVGDLTELVRGVSYDKAEVKSEPSNGYVPILRATNIDQSLDFEDLVFVPNRFVSDEQMLRSGDIVIAASSGSKSVVGKAAQFSGAWEGSFGAFCMGIRPFAPSDPRYLGYFFQSPDYRQIVSGLASGSNINNLKREHISELSFKLPPEGEQSRIVEKLDEYLSDLDAGISALERARANLKRYRAAVLKAAVEGRLTEKWRALHPDAEPAEKLLERILVERMKKWEEVQLKKFAEKSQSPPKGWKDKYPEPTKPDVASLPALPNGWCWATLEMLSEIVGGITKGQKREKGEVLREVPYLRVANVQRGFLDLEKMKTLAATEREIAELRLDRGDILFNEGGDRDKLGRGWVWEGAIDECIHQNHVFRARLLNRSIQPKFVSVHGNTFGKRWFQRTGKQSVNLASINMTVLRAFPVPVPSGAEQRAIVDEIEAQQSVCDAVEKQLDTEAVRATRLRQSILKRAFEGKLVPQDPKDEPASELLARIRATRGRENAKLRGGRGARAV